MALPTPLLVLNAMVAGAVIVVVLYTLAVFVRCSIELHQLKVETHRLRIAYFKRLAALRGDVVEQAEPIEVDVVEEAEGAPAASEEPGETAPPAAFPPPVAPARQAA